jgi:serine/threonine protein phosphatase 1
MKQKTFDVNTQGRDFVCGDLHGSFDLLMQFMINVNFNHDTDRMFSVGDLIDRGPDSLRCLELLDKKAFHCVKANHEQLMEDYFTGGPTGFWWMDNGGGWVNNLSPEQRQTVIKHFLPKVEELPLLITVNLENGKKFHVIHAEFFGLLDEKFTDEDLANSGFFQDIASRQGADGTSLMWDRSIFRDLYGKEITKQKGILHKAILAKEGITDFFNPQLSHIFSGHTPMREPTTILGQTNIDTMAFASNRHSWAGLTVVEPLTNKFWKSKEDGVHSVQPVVL